MGIFDKIKKYRAEEKLWRLAGKPIRDVGRMKEIHEICSACPLFEEGGGWLPGYDKCSKCGCNLHPTNTTMNKIAMATTECPLDEPLWGPDVRPK